MSHDEFFELGSSYDEMLQQGIGLAGETKTFFIDGRIAHLRCVLDVDAPQIDSILDFACGVGDTSVPLADAFGAREVVGVDVASGAVEEARRRVADGRVRFEMLDDIAADRRFDLCYVNGTYHHVPLDQRAAVTRRIYDSLRPGGIFALFDNNPLSIPARMVMRRIPFDRDARMLTAGTAARLMRDVGFATPDRPDYLFFFPNALAPLRRGERRLRHVPFGAQYLVVGRKPSATNHELERA